LALILSAALTLAVAFSLMFVYALNNGIAANDGGFASGFFALIRAGRPAYLSVVSDIRAMFAPFRGLTDVYFALFVALTLTVLLLMAAVFMLFISRLVFTPLRALRESARRIAGGDLDHVVANAGGDEIGTVCRTFEAMRLTLKESIAERLRFEDARKLMVATISHDLRTPITTIKGYVEGVLDGVAADGKTREQYLRTVLSKTSELEKMIDDLLLFSMADLGREAYQFADTDLRRYLADAVAELRADEAADGVEITFAQGGKSGVSGEGGESDESGKSGEGGGDKGVEGAPVTVSLDADHFKRVLTNLVGNSIKYRKRDDSGAAVKIDFRLNAGGRNAVIEVRDNGQGIETADLPKIFDVFYMSDKSRNKNNKSFGLGLAIAKQIVTAHNGKIWARSKPGAGASVFISLPKKECGQK
jgi:histidine kinase